MPLKGSLSGYVSCPPWGFLSHGHRNVQAGVAIATAVLTLGLRTVPLHQAVSQFFKATSLVVVMRSWVFVNQIILFYLINLKWNNTFKRNCAGNNVILLRFTRNFKGKKGQSERLMSRKLAFCYVKMFLQLLFYLKSAQSCSIIF